MTQEEKQVLLKDLSARLPYGVIVQYKGHNTIIKNKVLTGSDLDCNMEYYKPYLRPMSSMTEEEKEYLKNNFHFYFDEGCDGITNGIYSATFNRTVYHIINENDISDILDWLNAHHLDYRGLIPKGLAIKVTKENNPYKE